MTDTQTALSFRTMQSQADADAFRTLNEEWISKFFRLEEKDRETLNDPQGKIVNKGGQVYVAVEGDRVVGCVALIPYGDDSFELSKIAVSPEMRGQGVGRQLLTHVLQQALTLGAGMVFLGSNSVLRNAVHLYESLGFRHVPPSELPEMHYERADVFMKMDLAEVPSRLRPAGDCHG